MDAELYRAKILILISVPIVAGVIMGGITAIVMGSEQLVAFGVIFGGIGGVILIPIHWLLLRNKPITRTLPLVYIVAVIIWCPALFLTHPLLALAIVMLTVSVMCVIACIAFDDVIIGTSALDCTHCGYDLRADTSVQCPECGRPIPEEQKRAIDQFAQSDSASPSS